MPDIASLKKNAAPVESPLFTLAAASWQPSLATSEQAIATQALEQGKLLYLPQLPFALNASEQLLLKPETVQPGTKSIKFSPADGRLWGAAAQADVPALKAMLSRYAASARTLLDALLPGYGPHLITGNTSFRPVEAEGRVQSKRHDDRRLHVDAFPSRPMQGKRILRVFSNINPDGQARQWKTGEPFTLVAGRFLPRIARPLPGSALALKLLNITKETRTPYDHYMLRLHDAMKLDDSYQQTVAAQPLALAAGSSWIVFSDQVSHAALSGRHAMEQTFLLPVAAMQNPDTSPLRVLEAFLRKKLA